MFLGFFILKFLKSETLLVLLSEELIVLSATLSFKLHNRFGLSAFENVFTNRAVLLLFKCNLLLLRNKPSILLLLMSLIPLLLHKLRNFLLISLIFSSKSWSSRWTTLEKAIFISLLTSVSLMVVMTFLIF